MAERKSDRCIQNWYEEGCRLTHAGKLHEAVTAFSSAIDCNAGWAEAYFRRGVCYYLLGNCRLASNDMDAATLLGCCDAQMWSRYDIQQFDDSVED
jgi:tetratricopeptide (TPR) repeat protein